MTAKHISTSHEQQQCDICGRTLLRGEHADDFLEGSQVRSVCVLCENVALREGWVRASALAGMPVPDADSGRRRSLFGHRGRNKDERGERSNGGRSDAPQSLDDELAGGSRAERGRRGRRERDRDETSRYDFDERGFDDEPRRGRGQDTAPASRQGARRGGPARAPYPDQQPELDDSARRHRHSARDSRQIHAIPIDASQKIDAAIDAFNDSQYPRIVAGLGRSLGAPAVEVRPDQRVGTLVWIVLAWELCWYRYEIELSTDPAYVRQDSQGDELSELGSFQMRPNARIERDGRLLR